MKKFDKASYNYAVAMMINYANSAEEILKSYKVLLNYMQKDLEAK